MEKHTFGCHIRTYSGPQKHTHTHTLSLSLLWVLQESSYTPTFPHLSKLEDVCTAPCKGVSSESLRVLLRKCVCVTKRINMGAGQQVLSGSVFCLMSNRFGNLYTCPTLLDRHAINQRNKACDVGRATAFDSRLFSRGWYQWAQTKLLRYATGQTYNQSEKQSVRAIVLNCTGSSMRHRLKSASF